MNNLCCKDFETYLLKNFHFLDLICELFMILIFCFLYCISFSAVTL